MERLTTATPLPPTTKPLTLPTAKVTMRILSQQPIESSFQQIQQQSHPNFYHLPSSSSSSSSSSLSHCSSSRSSSRGYTMIPQHQQQQQQHKQVSSAIVKAAVAVVPFTDNDDDENDSEEEEEEEDETLSYLLMNKNIKKMENTTMYRQQQKQQVQVQYKHVPQSYSLFKNSTWYQQQQHQHSSSLNVSNHSCNQDHEQMKKCDNDDPHFSPCFDDNKIKNKKFMINKKDAQNLMLNHKKPSCGKTTECPKKIEKNMHTIIRTTTTNNNCRHHHENEHHHQESQDVSFRSINHPPPTKTDTRMKENHYEHHELYFKKQYQNHVMRSTPNLDDYIRNWLSPSNHQEQDSLKQQQQQQPQLVSGISTPTMMPIAVQNQSPVEVEIIRQKQNEEVEVEAFVQHPVVSPCFILHYSSEKKYSIESGTTKRPRPSTTMIHSNKSTTSCAMTTPSGEEINNNKIEKRRKEQQKINKKDHDHIPEFTLGLVISDDDDHDDNTNSINSNTSSTTTDTSNSTPDFLTHYLQLNIMTLEDSLLLRQEEKQKRKENQHPPPLLIQKQNVPQQQQQNSQLRLQHQNSKTNWISSVRNDMMFMETQQQSYTKPPPLPKLPTKFTTGSVISKINTREKPISFKDLQVPFHSDVSSSSSASSSSSSSSLSSLSSSSSSSSLDDMLFDNGKNDKSDWTITTWDENRRTTTNPFSLESESENKRHYLFLNKSFPISRRQQQREQQQQQQSHEGVKNRRRTKTLQICSSRDIFNNLRQEKRIKVVPKMEYHSSSSTNHTSDQYHFKCNANVPREIIKMKQVHHEDIQVPIKKQQNGSRRINGRRHKTEKYGEDPQQPIYLSMSSISSFSASISRSESSSSEAELSSSKTNISTNDNTSPRLIQRRAAIVPSTPITTPKQSLLSLDKFWTDRTWLTHTTSCVLSNFTLTAIPVTKSTIMKSTSASALVQSTNRLGSMDQAARMPQRQKSNYNTSRSDTDLHTRMNFLLQGRIRSQKMDPNCTKNTSFNQSQYAGNYYKGSSSSCGFGSRTGSLTMAKRMPKRGDDTSSTLNQFSPVSTSSPSGDIGCCKRDSRLAKSESLYTFTSTNTLQSRGIVMRKIPTLHRKKKENTSYEKVIDSAAGIDGSFHLTSLFNNCSSFHCPVDNSNAQDDNKDMNGQFNKNNWRNKNHVMTTPTLSPSKSFPLFTSRYNNNSSSATTAGSTQVVTASSIFRSTPLRVVATVAEVDTEVKGGGGGGNGGVVVSSTEADVLPRKPIRLASGCGSDTCGSGGGGTGTIGKRRKKKIRIPSHYPVQDVITQLLDNGCTNSRPNGVSQSTNELQMNERIQRHVTMGAIPYTTTSTTMCGSGRHREDNNAVMVVGAPTQLKRNQSICVRSSHSMVEETRTFTGCSRIKKSDTTAALSYDFKKSLSLSLSSSCDSDKKIYCKVKPKITKLKE